LLQWSKVAPRPSRLFSPSIFPFVATLGAFEALLFWYWVDLKLGQVLLYGGIVAIPTFFAGKTALASIGSRRVGAK
jgi:oligosaccharyltransferase complex subunit delta (ribophorin II)